jgi:serine/threonine protein kinase
MAIMDYANEGNLRGCLAKIIKNNWKQKLHMLYKIIIGLYEIHEKDLIHCDFHDGNILIHTSSNLNTVDKVYISDLGLCRPIKFSLEKDSIYGIVPFMAPEVLRGKPYTPASDIYSFSMIMWEFTSGITPFNNRAHDFQLSLSICKGERPEIIEKVPKCYTDLMKKCWNEDPSKRPSSLEVKNIIEKWIFLPHGKKIKDISEELKNNIMEFINAPPIEYNKPITQSHPQAYYASRLLPFTSTKLNEILSQFSDLIITDITSSKASVESQLSDFNPISSTNILYNLKSSSGIYKKK